MLSDKPIKTPINTAPTALRGETHIPKKPSASYAVPPGGGACGPGAQHRVLDGMDGVVGAARSGLCGPAQTCRWATVPMPRTRQGWADALWYLGHVMAVGSLVSRYSLPAAAVLVGVGQLMVIVSRPLGRGPAPVPRPADDSV